MKVVDRTLGYKINIEKSSNTRERGVFSKDGANSGRQRESTRN
jgi:hypothetical protein